MIFLIHYSRREARIKALQAFRDSDRSQAETARLKLELSTKGDSEHEVVLLEAQSEADLRRTHRRYFSSASDLFRKAAEEAAASVKPS
jgi:hypothetical protein